MADDFEEEEEELELDDEVEDVVAIDLDDADAEVLDADLDDADDDLATLDDAVVVVPDTVPRRKSGDGDSEDEDDENLDLEEELHPDDVEEPLDVLLAERTTAERIDEDEAELEDEELETEDRTEGGGRIVPRRDDEFLCRSCFLVKPLSQLAKGEKDLCRDCE
ncbi:MAG: DUF4193 family protein [Acidimicrobiia bacterium]